MAFVYYFVIRFFFLIKSFSSEHDIQKTLNNFCQFQKSINFPESHPLNHDVAILVSQLDFCSEGDENCETLGLAKMSGMCDPDNSCNVNQNTGLSLAFTIGKPKVVNLIEKANSSIKDLSYRKNSNIMYQNPTEIFLKYNKTRY